MVNNFGESAPFLRYNYTRLDRSRERKVVTLSSNAVIWQRQQKYMSLNRLDRCGVAYWFRMIELKVGGP